MNLTELRHLYSPTRKTQHPRVLVGKNSNRPDRWVLLFNDDLGDWDRSGPEYLSLAEAFAAVPAAAESYFGTADPAAPGTLPTPRRVDGVTISRPGDRLPSELNPGDWIHHGGSVRQVQIIQEAAADATPPEVWWYLQMTDGTGFHVSRSHVLTLAEPGTGTVLPFTVVHGDDAATTPTHTGQTTLMVPRNVGHRDHQVFLRAARELFALRRSERSGRESYPVRVWFEHQGSDHKLDYASGYLAAWEVSAAASATRAGRMTFTDGTELGDALLLRVTF